MNISNKEPIENEIADLAKTAGTPRWVKLFWVIFIILTLLFVVLHLTGNSPSSH